MRQLLRSLLRATAIFTSLWSLYGAWLYCECIDVVGDDYQNFMNDGSSTCKCQNCTRRKGAQHVAVLAEDYTKELPALDSNGNQTALVAKSCDMCGCVNNFLSTLCRKSDALVKEVLFVRADNASLRMHLTRNTEMLSPQTTENVEPVPLLSRDSQQHHGPATFATVAE